MRIQMPGAPSVFFLLFILGFMPLAAWRTAGRLRDASGEAPISRLTYWRSAVLTQLMLLVLALMVARSFGSNPFSPGDLSLTDVAAGFGALCLCLVIRSASRRLRSEEELRSLEVYKRSPRTAVELRWFGAAVVAASIAEEVAYRGVGWSILWYMTGESVASAAILCIAFAVTHWSQGWKSGVGIALIAAVMHGLVAITGTLLVAMAVHGAYDVIVGGQIRRTPDHPSERRS